MSSNADRMWSIRDAILLWLYEMKAALHSPASLTATAVQEGAGWAAEPLTQDEVDRDAKYLAAAGYIRGDWEIGGRGMSVPAITHNGETLVARGISVRPGLERPAEPTGVTHTYNITNHAPAQMAINSSDFAQNMTLEAKQERVNQVADALDRYADEGLDRAQEARSLAEQIREAGGDVEANVGPLRALLASAVSVIAVSAGTEVGQQVMALATGVLPMLAG